MYKTYFYLSFEILEFKVYDGTINTITDENFSTDVVLRKDYIIISELLRYSRIKNSDRIYTYKDLCQAVVNRGVPIGFLTVGGQKESSIISSTGFGRICIACRQFNIFIPKTN